MRGRPLLLLWLCWASQKSMGPVEAQAVVEATHPREKGLSSPAVLDAAGVVNNTYRGDWSWRRRPEALPLKFLQRGSGMVVFRLQATPGAREGVHTVRGQLILRDGEYATDPDIVLRLSGMFIVELGKLVGWAEAAGQEFRGGSGSGAVSERYSTEWYSAALREAAAGKLVEENTVELLAAAKALGPTCPFAVELKFAPASSSTGGGSAEGQGEGTPPEILVRGTISSEGCGITLAVDASAAHADRYAAKAFRYIAMMTFVALVQVVLTLRQMEAASSAAAASRISLLCIGQQAVVDGYVCLVHLTLAFLVEPLFDAFATAAFVGFGLFGIFELRLILGVWRARRGASIDPWSLQRDLSMIYARVYCALLIGILLSYYLQQWRHIAAVTLLLHAFWVPQIVLCARENCPQPLQATYVVGTSLARLPLPLYFFGCPNNLLRVQPSLGMCAAVAVLMVAQAAILLLQRSYGPRCFIPSRFLPKKYDYGRPLPPKAQDGGPKDIETGDGSCGDCVICMNGVQERDQYMVAPCDHVFHRICLERWMRVKLECPTCRRPLPLP